MSNAQLGILFFVALAFVMPLLAKILGLDKD